MSFFFCFGKRIMESVSPIFFFYKTVCGIRLGFLFFLGNGLCNLFPFIFFKNGL